MNTNGEVRTWKCERPTTLPADFEAVTPFKVYDGQIHAVEAFMRILPVEKRNGGWP